jgi:hypothetical protein
VLSELTSGRAEPDAVIVDENGRILAFATGRVLPCGGRSRQMFMDTK